MDIDLAVALGFENPVNIRKLIPRNAEELRTFGIISTVEKIPEVVVAPQWPTTSTKNRPSM